jgi:hypothetical protein
MLTRKPDWPHRLHRFLLAQQDRRFAYGSWDCCLWVCEAVKEMTGVDPAAPFRSKYSTRTQAYQLMREYGGRASVEAIVSRVLDDIGMPEVSVLRAHRGDMALIPRGANDHSLALVALNGRELLTCTARGFASIPLTRAVRAWSV